MASSLITEQVRHDRINLGRLVKRLEVSINGGLLNGSNLSGREDAGMIVQGVTQKLKYARKLLSKIEMLESINLQSSYLQSMRNTLSKLDEIVELANTQFELPPYDDMDYLSLVPSPPPVADGVATNIEQSKLDVEVSDDSASLIPPSKPFTTDAVPVPSNQDPQSLLSSSSQQGQLLSSSLKTHEELSDQLARMAVQLRRNAEHFSNALEKDKSLVLSAEEVLMKNVESMAHERDRLKKHSWKSFGTTWITIGAILVVCLTWIWMFFIIRLT